MRLLELLRHNSFQLLEPVSIIVLTLILGLLAKRLLFAALTRWAKKTPGQIDDIIVQAVKGPFMIWVLILAIHLAAQTSPLPERISGLIAKILLFLLIASMTAVGAKMASEIIRVYGTRVHGTLPVTSLTQNLARLTVIITGL